MKKEGKLFTFSIGDESSYDSREEGGEAMVASGEGEYEEFEPLDAQLHEQVLLTAASEDTCRECACATASESWMLPHALTDIGRAGAAASGVRKRICVSARQSDLQ